MRNPPWKLRIQVRRKVRRQRRKGYHVRSNNHAKRQNTPRRRRRRHGSLAAELRAATPRRNSNGNERRSPSKALVDMKNAIPAEGNEEGQQSDDDDARDRGERAAGHGGQALPADNAADDAKPGQRGEVQDHGDGRPVAPEAVARLDHLAEACPRAQGPEVCWRQGCQGGEGQDDEGAVAQGEGVGCWAEHAEG